MQTQKAHLKAVNDIPRWGCLTASGELADSNIPGHEHRVVGVSEGSIATGDWGDATMSGRVFDLTWTWTPGAPIYLNSTGLSETAPGAGFVQQIGWALTAQSILVNVV